MKSNFRIVAAGSGTEGLSEPQVRDAIVRLSGKATPSVLYLGTATYDREAPEKSQTERFRETGCPITPLRLVSGVPIKAVIEEVFAQADVVIVSGGNTLFAVDCWLRFGVDRLLRQALQRGVVLSGGSAGAICWFDGGHSDSMDPETYQNPPIMNAEEQKQWQYIRVPGLGFLPGLCCPHHDRIQSNGVPRASDFDAMLLRHPGETGIGIDHFAALVIEGDNYQVLSNPARPGSVEGRPGLWKKTIRAGEVQASVVPAQGNIGELLHPATEIVQDSRIASARAANPFPQISG